MVVTRSIRSLSGNHLGALGGPDGSCKTRGLLLWRQQLNGCLVFHWMVVE